MEQKFCENKKSKINNMDTKTDQKVSREAILFACIKMDANKVYDVISFEDHSKLKTTANIVDFLNENLNKAELETLFFHCIGELKD